MSAGRPWPPRAGATAWGWLQVALAVPGSIVAVLFLCKPARSRPRRRMRYVRGRVWGIEWERLDVTNDDQP